MQVDFFVLSDSDGNKQICELATGRVVYIRPDEFFDFGFKTEIVELGKKNDKFWRFHFSIMNKQNEFERSVKASLGMYCFFLRRV